MELFKRSHSKHGGSEDALITLVFHVLDNKQELVAPASKAKIQEAVNAIWGISAESKLSV